MISAKFVGINKHKDEMAGDLIGAVRDATALWALFCDTFAGKDLDAELITDENAKAASLREAIEGTLNSAASDDIVVISFAGHGTKNHRLVANDTTVHQLDQTSIGMDELAVWFRNSQAQAVICILDCCFSGGAPARVIEDTPISREVQIDVTTMGKGRVMITAAGLKEIAYEHPTRRHGLLTAALIDVFTEQDGTFSLPTALDEIQQRVRADAAAIGKIQTPVVLGIIEGGLILPVFRRGEHFHKQFPEAKALMVSSDFADLADAGIPDSIITAWSVKYPNGLNELQVAAVNDYQVLTGSSLIVVAPTSAGKTFIGELAGIRAVLDGCKVVFLLPYRALVNEKFEDFTALYGNELGLRVIRCSGDYLDQRTAFVKSKFDIAVLTFEMFLALAMANTGLLSRLGLVVLDEAQFIADPDRGIIVELILAYLKRQQERGINPQLVLLSATIGALNGFDSWLNINVLVSDTRPVPLEFGVLDRNGEFEFIDADNNRRIEQLLPYGSVIQRRQNASSQDVIVPLVRDLTASEEKREKVLIFRNRRGSAEGCARYIARDVGLAPETEVADQVPASDQSSTTTALRESLKGGTALHTSNLTRDERVVVERAFRDPESRLRVLVATTTVAAGINTPASTVIIVEHGFPWEDRDMTVAEIRNMAGRAGRLGYRETGRAILLSGSTYERERLFNKYVVAEPAPMTSSFTEDHIGTWLIRLLAQATPPSEVSAASPLGIPKDDVPGLIASTFGGYLRARANPGWTKQAFSYVQEIIPRLLRDGVIDEDADHIHLTLLGRAIAESSLTLESSLQLVERIHELNSGEIRPETLMVLIQALPELDDRYTPIFKRGARDTGWPQQAARRYGGDMVRLLQRRAGDEWVYYARAKRACVLGDWIDGIPVLNIEKQYTAQARFPMARGDIQGIADTSRFHLSSAHKIVTILRPEDSSASELMDELLARLEVGLPAELLNLLECPITFSRGEYLALAGEGILTIDNLKTATSESLSRVLATDQAAAVQQWREREAMSQST